VAIEPTCGLEGWKFGLSIVGYLGAALAFVVGLRQYRRADYWKRSEFLAKEMKEFFDAPEVMAALTMIDWGVRRVKLSVPSPPNSRGVLIDRKLQCDALRPHTMLNAHGSSDEVSASDAVISDGSFFTPEQAAIRDAYDRFMDGLERFGNYLTGRLVSVDDLKPYLGYWVTSIADTECDGDDALWSVFLLAYIEFYAFIGVQRLFADFGYNIQIDGPLVQTFVQNSSDLERAKAVVSHVRTAQRLGHSRPGLDT
jgi:hypothetical protein